MGFDPELFDLLQPGSFRGDIEWYCRKAIASGGPVLELGAGTGRIAIPIARAGIDVTALELDEQMLRRLDEKVVALPDAVRSHLTLSSGDMRSFAVERTFALIIIAGHSFLHNVSVDDQLGCLRCVHDHLRPGGELAFNVNFPSLEYMAQHTRPPRTNWRWILTRDLPDGGYVVYSQAVRYDTIRQRVFPMTRVDFCDSNGELVRTTMVRLELAYLYPADIGQLLHEAELELIRLSGDFTDRPFRHEDHEVVVEAKRPKSAR